MSYLRQNFFILLKSYVPFSRYLSFCIFSHRMIYQICEVMMSISTWDRVYFWIYLWNHNSLSHHTWPTDRYEQGQHFWGTFWTIWKTGANFQVLFNLATRPNYSITSYVKIPVFQFFEKLNKGMSAIKNGQLLLYFGFNKIIKEPWTSFQSQYWAKNVLEMFFIQYTSIWPNFIW